ncbi:MAG: T9SS type A sorting domain-containing protein, partial [Bacteroidales bacterium]|nr:T9SS type A sorting domain-containing protein [Bacteroidales bacterium]
VFEATEGWGPFITNNYTFSDTSWHPVPELNNTFTVKNLPPRADTLVFQILTADSTVVDSLVVYATQGHGHFLDSAVFPNVRMDMLPLSTRYLRTLIRCNGAPKKGLEFHKALTVIPQKPKLISKSEGITLIDSIGVFTQNLIAGQALEIDSVKYAIISNGPGIWCRDNELRTIYRGPYCFDLFKSDYSIEAWLKFDLEKLQNIINGEVSFMSVDSVWSLNLFSYGDELDFIITSIAGGNFTEIITATVPFASLSGDEWHHIAFTSDYPGSGASHVNFYLDGEKWNNVILHEDNYWYIINNVDYFAYMGTQPLILGTNPAFPPDEPSYVTAMDEVRLWGRALSAEDVKNNYHRTILQEDWLFGYWNFDDLRNRLGYIVDVSYYNNTGHLKNGAALIPQHSGIQELMDTIIIHSSNALTDSIKFSFIDKNSSVIESIVVNTQNSSSQLNIDVSAFPYSLNKFRVSEFFPGSTPNGFITDYEINELAPTPIATPLYNWNIFYYSPNDYGRLYNRIIVSGLPEKTEKVILGLEKENQFFDIKNYTENSIPYRYSLSLNGSDNYIETSQSLDAPKTFRISLWFKTSTSEGGKLIGFTDTQNGITNNMYDREIILEKDGSIRFIIKSGNSIYTLTANNKYNDGEWHFVTAELMEASANASLSLDGAIVDYSYLALSEVYNGYWVIGRNNINKSNEKGSIAEYFEGSLSEIYIWIPDKNQVELLYRLDERIGTVVHDTKGNNDGVLKGNSQNWNYFESLSFVAWKENMINKSPGDYNFFAKVYYTGGPDTGVFYPLGKYIIKDPFPENYFAYDLTKGLGSFNEGTQLYNTFNFQTDYNQQGQPDWMDNFVKYLFLSPEHEIISQNVYPFTGGGYEGGLTIDMGDAPPGSYLSIEQGYHTNDNTEHITNTFSIPIYINPMLAPKVTGNFGPFSQAIAPGTMECENTFVITTEILSDLHRVTGIFYDDENNEIATKNAVKINDTTWHITYNMAILSPPITLLKIEYYLGQDEFLALTEGPFKIHIHKTRPRWFDFIPDNDFSDIHEYGNDSVVFSVKTSFGKVNASDIKVDLTIPDWVPFLGGSGSHIDAPSSKVFLRYTKADYKLKLDEPPIFSQNVLNLGADATDNLFFDFHASETDSYYLDDKNDLFASQNFSVGGGASYSFDCDKITEKAEELLNLVSEVEDPIFAPTFGISFSGELDYSSRLHLTIDTNTGHWGSTGDLEIDANPDHTQAYQNSASYHFYSLTLGVDFEVGMTFLDGLVEGDFDVDLYLPMGFGHSYVTIPKLEKRPLSSVGFDVYGKFVIKVLWGWYEKTIWGPKLFYSTTLWGDDMSKCFPPQEKNDLFVKSISANSSWPELGKDIIPVSGYSKMPMAYPEQSIVCSDNYKMFTWIERGDSYGERNTAARFINDSTGKFSKKITLENNNHAINHPSSAIVNNNTLITTWTQTRHTNESILEVKSSNVIKDFVLAQDIWFTCYDLENGTLQKLAMLDDDTATITSGRTEGNPEVIPISDNRALIVWQVVVLETHKSDIWYVLLEKQNDTWTVSTPAIVAEIEGIETFLEIASPKEDMAVMVWMNNDQENTLGKRIMTASFNETEWTQPTVLFTQVDNNYLNYMDIAFNNGLGAIVLTTFVKDSAIHRYETLSLLPWDPVQDQWSNASPIVLITDSLNHLQLPEITVGKEGNTVVALKVEHFVKKTVETRISQVDLFVGDLNYPYSQWNHIAANEFVCDTTKQVADLDISFIGKDTLMILSQEYVMLPTNAPFEPKNGIIFGNRYMNLVLRSFYIDDQGSVEDINEYDYYLGIEDDLDYSSDVKLYQNFPNPCLGSTTIQFYIPHDTPVKLELFDMNGVRTAVLVDNKLLPGMYEINLNTAILKPGPYIYKLTTDDVVRTLKMMVGY